MKLLISAAVLTFGASLAAAHDVDPPKTTEQAAIYQKELEAFYHCAPVIASYTAQRKRSWVQKFLGSPDATSSYGLFLDEAFNDLNLDKAEAAGKKVLACTETETRKIMNNTCLMSPVVTQGPYYHQAGHPVRQNMAENELGPLFLMDIGVLDVETCRPVEGVLVDLWHANATGHYSGHADPAPHLINEIPATEGVRKGLLTAYPRWNQIDTFLRAAWPTNKDGVAQFTSVWPGYYTGRATHVHARVHPEWDTLDNGTFISKRLVYTGQFFVPDDLNMQLDKIHPYTTNPIVNKWGRTRNWDDSLHIYHDSQKNGNNPIFDIHPLGGVFMQGHIAYMTVGVNMSASYGYGWDPAGRVL